MRASDVRQGLIRLGYKPNKVEQFMNWKAGCPQVWREFERITLELIDMDKKAGAMDILGKIRWECEIMGGRDFKVNNTMAPYLSRVFAMKHPRYKDYFEFREVGYEREAA